MELDKFVEMVIEMGIFHSNYIDSNFDVSLFEDDLNGL